MNKTKLSDAERAAFVARIRRNYDYDDRTGKLVNMKTGRTVVGKSPRCRHRYKEFGCWDGRRTYLILYHHAVWAWHHGRFPKQIDHIDGNRLNNRIGNLREVSTAENLYNRVYPWVPNDVTGLPGVIKKRRQYRVMIRGRDFYFPDKHQAFVIATLCGKRYRKIKTLKNSHT